MKFNGVRAQLATFLREKAHKQWRESERCVLFDRDYHDDDHNRCDLGIGLRPRECQPCNTKAPKLIVHVVSFRYQYRQCFRKVIVFEYGAFLRSQ